MSEDRKKEEDEVEKRKEVVVGLPEIRISDGETPVTQVSASLLELCSIRIRTLKEIGSTYGKSCS